ncbi:MAG: transposase, partial [Pseudanabaenaceae cyanobacterium]
SKTEEVGMYFADWCRDMQSEKVEQLLIVLDNNSTHKDKMIGRLSLTDKIKVEFLDTPAYSPEFNLT